MNLFKPWEGRNLTSRNRIVVSPMCQYSSDDGFANDWHLVHLGSLATGGAGIVFTEATAISAIGRISCNDLGIYKPEHVEKLKQITDYIKSQGAIPGIQLAHAGRKASAAPPWERELQLKPEDREWEPIAPSAIAFHETYPLPKAMTLRDIELVVEQFVAASKRSLVAGFEVIELHAAHGYLLHEFLSPLSNSRTDEYGGSLENRARLLRMVAKSIRTTIPTGMPLFVRVSATDWTEGGFDIKEAIQVSKWLKEDGIDLIDVSSGGNIGHADIPVGPGYQVPLASQIKAEAGIEVGAVGMITEPWQAETILATGQADLVIMARELLRNPHWPAKAARDLGVEPSYVPNQYRRAW